MSKLFPWIYDLFMSIGHRRIGRWREAVVAPACGLVLEVGAGTGLNFPHYRKGASVVATDVDLAMIGRSRARALAAASPIAFVAADAEALPFRDGTFDECVVGLAMCTIPHPDRALRELHRALVTAGRLRLLEHVRVDSPVIGRLQDWLTPLWRRVAGGCRLNRRTAQAVAANGFQIDRIESHIGGYVLEIVAHAVGSPPISGSKAMSIHPRLFPAGPRQVPRPS